ncbi:unnamed protein product [Lactuca saligna]|uniref:C2H2-type domain-containing protein n=1 Tax=Lactuca saligna TaxID=75948 RepID=A0AA35Z1Y0_LACSI|nr:unnamed protein product [Lactuca saligna]
MASGSSFSSMPLFGNTNEEDHFNEANNIQQDTHGVSQTQPQTVRHKKRRNTPKFPCKFFKIFMVIDSDVEVIALSPATLMAKNRFVCEVCYKGFPRDQNLQLHKRGHNLPWKLKQKSATDDLKRKVYVCPEPTCVNHEPSHALGDLTGIKKHYSRKHGERKYKCQKCEKMYAVNSDLKAHSKTCGTKEYPCHCGTVFGRRDSFINHRAYCEALAEGITTIGSRGVTSFKSSRNHNQPSQMNTTSPQLGPQLPSTQNLIKTSINTNYYKPTPALFGPSSNQNNPINSPNNTITNLVNNTSTLPNNMQLYNLSMMGNPINSGSGEGLSLFSSGSFVSHHSTSLYFSSHTETMRQHLSATGTLQKAGIFGSTSGTNNFTDFTRGIYTSSSSTGGVSGTNSEKGRFLFRSGHFSGSNDEHYSNMNELLNSFSGSGVGSSVFNRHTGASNAQEDGYQGGVESGGGGCDEEWKKLNSVEEEPPQNSNFNMGLEQFSGGKTTRDFLGVGGEIVGDISSDGAKSTFAVRSFL